MLVRLDILITEKKLAKSRSLAIDLIKKGLVKINGKIITKPSKETSPETNIEVIQQPKYVGRGGLKLEKALNEFRISSLGLVILDVGSSTGGFTDCLLQSGAKKIYAVDVGTGQLDEKLINDQRVISMEKTDIRNIKELPEKPDMAVIDASFISLELILNNVAYLLTKKAKIIALIKPQFETSKKDKNKGGIVKNEEIRLSVLEKIKDFCQNNYLKVINIIDSPILGGSGNKEFLILLEKIN